MTNPKKALNNVRQAESSLRNIGGTVFDATVGSLAGSNSAQQSRQDIYDTGKAMGQAIIEPYREAIAEGKPMKAVGRAAFDIAGIMVGAHLDKVSKLNLASRAMRGVSIVSDAAVEGVKFIDEAAKAAHIANLKRLGIEYGSPEYWKLIRESQEGALKVYKKGKKFEEIGEKILEKKFVETSREISARPLNWKKGRTRLDLVGTDENGAIHPFEFKSSSSAPLTKNQKAAFVDIEEYGAVIVGKGKQGFEGGTIIPPKTKVQIVRPNDLGMNDDWFKESEKKK